MADDGKKITIYPIEHLTGDDFTNGLFKELVARYDAIFIEKASSDDTDEMERMFNLMSLDGKNRPDWRTDDLAGEAMISVLRGCKKRIYFEHSVFSSEDIRTVLGLDDMSAGEYANGEPEKSFRTVREYYRAFGSMQRVRDGRIVGQLIRLQQDGENGVMVVIGGGHRENIAARLRGNGCKVDVLRNYEIPRTITNDMEASCYEGRVPDDLGAARVIPEGMMIRYMLGPLQMHPRRAAPAARRAVEKLDYGSSCELSRELGRRRLLSEEDKAYLVCEKLGAF